MWPDPLLCGLGLASVSGLFPFGWPWRQLAMQLALGGLWRARRMPSRRGSFCFWRLAGLPVGVRTDASCRQRRS